MLLEFKKVHPDAKEPTLAHEGDAGYDVYATSKEDLGDGRIKYGLGLAFNLKRGTRLDIRARSGIHKTGLIFSNGVGTGDEPYIDEYSVVFYNIIPELPSYEIGDRIAQIIIDASWTIEFVEVDEIQAKSRGVNNNGYGSSGLR